MDLRSMASLIGIGCALATAGLHLSTVTIPESIASGASPTQAEIKARIRLRGRGWTDADRRLISELLTARYRKLMIPVRVILSPDYTIDLLCGANMNYRDMALIALQVLEDVETLSGAVWTMTVDATYAAGPRRRVARLTGSGREGRVLRFAPSDPSPE